MGKLWESDGVDESRLPLREALLEEASKQVQGGIAPDDLIVLLHDRGLSIVESMVVFVKVYKLPLGEAKLRVTAHPVWDAVVRANEPLHDALEEAIRKPLNDQ